MPAWAACGHDCEGGRDYEAEVQASTACFCTAEVEVQALKSQAPTADSEHWSWQLLCPPHQCKHPQRKWLSLHLHQRFLPLELGFDLFAFTQIFESELGFASLRSSGFVAGDLALFVAGDVALLMERDLALLLALLTETRSGSPC